MAGNRKEQISSVELWSTMCVFITASATILPVGATAGHNSWISVILATAVGLGFAWIYTALCDSHPGMSIVEIGELLTGKWGGKAIGLIYAWVGLHLSALVLSDHWKFTSAVALPKTPILIIAGTMVLLVVWISYAGIESIGRVSILIAFLVVFYTATSFILLSKDFDSRNLLPVADNKLKEILFSALQISTLPFGEGVLFVTFFSHLRKNGPAKKPSLLGIAVPGLLIFVINIMNTLVLGELSSKLGYPTYTAYSYMQVSDFLDRAEIVIYTLFITMSFIKMSVSFYASAVCLSKILNVKNYRIFLIPLGFLMLELSLFIYHSQAEVANWITYVWPWYALPFQFLIPLLLLVLTAVRKGRKKDSD